MFKAAREGKIRDVQRCIRRGVNINEKDQDGYTALHSAVSEGQRGMVEYLIRAGADIHTRSKDGCTALHLAVSEGQRDIAEYLIKAGADIHTRANDGNTALLLAVSEGQRDIAEYLIKAGAYIHTRNNDGGVALLLAVSKGHRDIAEYLIRAGADITIRDRDGNTALHDAVSTGHRDIAEYLIKAEADINARNSDGWTALLLAVSQGHRDIAEYLIREGANIHIRDDDGNTALHKAVSAGHRDIAEYLIKAGADINARNNDGWTALHKAVSAGHRDIAEYLTREGAHIKIPNNDGNTALHDAVSEGKGDIAEYLIRAGADMNKQNNDGWTALHKAVSKGHRDIAEYLIREGADIQIRDNDGWTALLLAISKSHGDIAEYLIREGADMSKQSNDGWTALLLAVSKGHRDIAEYLIRAGADIHTRDEDGWTALPLAVSEGHVDIAEDLIREGSDMNAQNNDGWTALHWAVSQGHRDIAEYLIREGADIHIRESDGWTALLLAVSEGHEDIAEYLIKEGADIHIPNNDGWTALLLAVSKGHRDIAEYLIREGADIHTRNNDGWTALHLAVSAGHRDIAEYLIREGADMSKQSNDGWTALHKAVTKGHRDIAAYLIREGVDIEIRNNKCKTPVDLANDEAMRELIINAHAERQRQEENAAAESERQKQEEEAAAAEAERLKQEVEAAAAVAARRCASDVSVVHSKVLEVRSLRKPDSTSRDKKLMFFIADDDLRDSVMGLLSAFESKDSWLTAPCIEAVESVDGSDSVFAELERKLLSLQESIRCHVESKDVDMEYLQGLQGERDSVRRDLVSVMRTILAAPVEKWLEVLKQVYDGCRWSGNEVIEAVECIGETRHISSTELMTLLSDFEDKMGEWVGECSRSPAEETERALAAFHKCLGCVGEMLVDENSMSMHNLEVCSKELDECLRIERDHWQYPMRFYPDIRRDTREACVAVARFTTYWCHKASEIVQQRARIRNQLEEMEVWVDGPPKGEIFSGLLDDIRNAQKRIAQCKFAIEIQELEGDKCDRTRQQQLEEDMKNAKVDLQLKRNALCKERAALSRIALTHFPEMPILCPGIGFDPKDLPDIAKGLLIIDRSIGDYSDLVESNSRNLVMRGCFAKRNVFLKAFSCSNEDQQKSFWREARILATHCQSPYIADITAVFLEKGKAYIEMPFYINGNLALYLERQKHGLSILSKRLLCNDVLNGLAHLHGNNVVHCDVKPDNILISDRGTAMLTDFDISIDSLSRDQSTLGGKMRGSHDFMAPEIFIGNSPSYASDMYSFGVCVLHIFGLECNRGSMDKFLVHKIPKCDGELNDLRNRLREVLCQNPEERLSSRDALQKSFFAIQDLANDIQTLRERIVCQEREIAQERERLEKEQQARMRVCCLCDEEVDMCQGLQCKGEARHFTCESCLNAYVKVEATSERGRRRLVHIWDISGQRDLYLRGNKGDILREFRQVANSTELQKPWPNMRAPEFNEVWEERTDYGGEFRIMCPYHSHGCNVGPFDSHKVVRLLTEEVHRLYQRSERELVAWREICHYEEAQRLEKIRLAALSEKDREIQTHGNYIRNCILSLRCPRCAWLFTPDSLDYGHCLALYCPNCNCGFCGYCLHDCGDDAHQHTANCRYNNRRPNVFSRRADYEESQRLRRTELLKAYLATIRVGIREEVINAVTEIISELGITI